LFSKLAATLAFSHFWLFTFRYNQRVTISKRQNPQVPNQQTALHAIEEALTLLHFVQTLEGPEKDSVEHLLEATMGSLRERCPQKPRRGIENQADAEVVPLQSAVLCVDCESVSNSRFDECPVCGNHSLFSIARMLGGTLLPDKVNCAKKDDNILLFDLEITIYLKQMEPKDLNAVVEGITSLIEPRLGRGRASFHIKVEPVVDSHTTDEAIAA